MRTITCTRMLDGTATCSVPYCHRHHSPDKVDFGYEGSAPADLALNIVAAALPLEPGDNDVRLAYDSRVSKPAWDLHEAFTRTVLGWCEARVAHPSRLVPSG